MSIVVNSAFYSVKDFEIVKDISIEIMPGELLTVLGPNGSGKSTLLKLISGDITPTKGEIFIDSEPLKTISIRRRALKRSVMSQSQQIMYDFSVEDIIRMGWLNDLKNKSNFNFLNILKDISSECEISHLLNRSINNLSGGEQRRVHFARALIQLKNDLNNQDNKYMLLDEPTANLDISYELNLIKILKKEVSNGIGVFLILHDLNLALNFSDKIALLKEGRLVEFGQPMRIFNDKTLSEIYDTPISVDLNSKRVNYY
tara:strand:+ start:1798 stop:2571 length:774 start_codon:yes stop_codon:yes gene_type:complete